MRELGTIPEIEAFIAAHPVVILEFGASWCAPCKQLEPILAQLQERYQVEIAKIDVQVVEGAQMRYEIGGLPTLILLRNGQPVNALAGKRAAATIATVFELALRDGRN